MELAIQAAMLHTKRHAFVSLEDSYHGNTFGAMSVAGSEYREKFPRLLPNCHKIEPPLDDDALERIETRLKRRDVAAFIMEPVSINLGVCIPEPGFMEGLRALCTRYRTLLAQVAATSDYFRERIGEIEFGSTLTLNMLGLAIGLHFEDDDYGDGLADRCRKNGLLVAPQSSDVLLLPALNIDRRTASRGLDILAESA